MFDYFCRSPGTNPHRSPYHYYIMLILLLNWLYIFCSSFSLGLLVHRAIGKLAPGGTYDMPVPMVSVTGLVTLSVVLGYASLALPMNHAALHLAVLTFTAVATWYFRSEYRQLWLQLRESWSASGWIARIFLVVFSLFIIVKASGQVQSLDSGAYHLPFIKWVESYPVIKGLANVHSRFGFNYHYHILCAFYGLSGIMGTTLHNLNGFLFFLGLVYFYGMLRRSANDPFFHIVALIALLYISQINKGMTGFSPDFPVAIIQMMLVFECFRYLLRIKAGSVTTAGRNRFAYTICWVMLGAITLKLATVAVLFVVLIACFRDIFRLKNLALLTLFGVVAFIPYFTRNYLISGYLVYPFYSVDIFDVLWKIPMNRTIEEKLIIKNYALGYPNFYDGAYHYNAALFRTWWKNLSFLNKIYPPLIAVIGLCTGIVVVRWVVMLFKKDRNQWTAPVNIILYGLVAGLLFWFFNAPDPRFGNGIILPFVAIVFAGIAVNTGLYRWAGKGAVLCFLLITASSLLSLSGMALSQTTYQTNTVRMNPVMQEPYPAPDTTSVTIDGYHTYQSSNVIWGKCWECPLPCSYPMDKFRFIEPGNIEKGFRSGDADTAR